MDFPNIVNLYEIKWKFRKTSKRKNGEKSLSHCTHWESILFISTANTEMVFQNYYVKRLKLQGCVSPVSSEPPGTLQALGALPGMGLDRKMSVASPDTLERPAGNCSITLHWQLVHIVAQGYSFLINQRFCFSLTYVHEMHCRQTVKPCDVLPT